MGIFDRPAQPEQYKGPLQVMDPNVLQKLDSIYQGMSRILDKLNAPTRKQEIITISTEPITFDTYGYKNSVLIVTDSQTVTVEMPGGFKYSLGLQLGPNQVDFPDGANISATTKFSAVLIRDNHPILPAIPVAEVSLVGSNTNFSEEGNAGTADTPYTANVKQWFTFSNDDAADDIQINFDAPVGSVGTMTIKPGEVLNGMPRAFTTLHVKCTQNTPAFRAWGV